MNRELVDFYNQNNYNIFGLTANRNILKTVLDNYRELRVAVQHIIDVDNQIRNRRHPVEAWVIFLNQTEFRTFHNLNFLFRHFWVKKLSYRKRYVKKMKERNLVRTALASTNNLETLTRLLQNQQTPPQSPFQVPIPPPAATISQLQPRIAIPIPRYPSSYQPRIQVVDSPFLRQFFFIDSFHFCLEIFHE